MQPGRVGLVLDRVEALNRGVGCLVLHELSYVPGARLLHRTNIDSCIMESRIAKMNHPIFPKVTLLLWVSFGLRLTGSCCVETQRRKAGEQCRSSAAKRWPDNVFLLCPIFSRRAVPDNALKG